MEPMARTRSPIGRHVIALLLMALGLGITANVSAQRTGCTLTFTGTGGEKRPIKVPNPFRIPSDAPVGTVLYSETFSWPRIPTVANCKQGQNGATREWGFQMTTNGSTGSYKQIIPGMSPTTWEYDHPGSGLGVRWYVDNVPVTSASGLSFDMPGGPGTVISSPAETWRVEVVKTAISPSNPAKTFGIEAGEAIPGFHPQTGQPGYAGGARVSSILQPVTNPVTVIWPSGACDIATDNLTIRMGDWDADQLDQSFATPLSAPQNIVLNCPANPGAALSFSGTVVPGSQAPNTFALTPGSNTAGNVGVQFFINNNPNVAIRTDTQYPVGSSTTAGTVNIPIQARYIKTGKPTPGRANSTITATFTFN